MRYFILPAHPVQDINDGIALVQIDKNLEKQIRNFMKTVKDMKKNSSVYAIEVFNYSVRFFETHDATPDDIKQIIEDAIENGEYEVSLTDAQAEAIEDDDLTDNIGDSTTTMKITDDSVYWSDGEYNTEPIDLD